jgi:hypothetical protein
VAVPAWWLPRAVLRSRVGPAYLNKRLLDGGTIEAVLLLLERHVPIGQLQLAPFHGALRASAPRQHKSVNETRDRVPNKCSTSKRGDAHAYVAGRRERGAISGATQPRCMCLGFNIRLHHSNIPERLPQSQVGPISSASSRTAAALQEALCERPIGDPKASGTR